MKPLKLVLILGSVRPDRFSDVIGNWATAEIERQGRFSLEMLDPRRDWPAVDSLQIRAVLERADAFLIVTPEYNHSFPGPLKVVIDTADTQWAAKPVAFVSYGGLSGGLRAVEHLRGVFSELDAVSVRESVSFQNPWETLGHDRRPTDTDRQHRAMGRMLSRLDWWSRALANAREAEAFGAAA